MSVFSMNILRNLMHWVSRIAQAARQRQPSGLNMTLAWHLRGRRRPPQVLAPFEQLARHKEPRSPFACAV